MPEIRLEPHDPVWHERFEAERDRVRDASADGPLGVFHIGSTAVSDIAAKPVVDVLGSTGDTTPRGRPQALSSRRATTSVTTNRTGSG